MKRHSNAVLLLLVLFVSILDILNTSSRLLDVVSDFACALTVFLLGLNNYQYDKSKHFILFILSLLVLLLTFTHKIYFINMLILSYLLWDFISPWVLKWNHAFKFSVLLSFLSMYSFLAFGMIIPVFPLVFYPLYLLGILLKQLNIQKSKRLFLVLIINTIFSSSVIYLLFLNAEGSFITNNPTFTRLQPINPTSALYTSVFYLFYLWLFVNIYTFLYAYTRIFAGIGQHSEVLKATEDLQGYLKSFPLLFFFLGALTFLSSYILTGQMWSSFSSLLSPMFIINMVFLASIYLLLTAVIGKGLSILTTTLAALLLFFANYVKLKYFNEPFYPWDTYLLRNAVLISGQYLNAQIVSIAFTALSLLVFIVFKYRGSLKKSLKLKPSLYLLPLSLAFFIMNTGILGNTEHLSQLGLGKSWYVGKEEILSNGLFIQNYFYLSELGKYLYSRPEEYSYSKVAEVNQRLSMEDAMRTGSEIKPNIIVIMSESFWDPTQLKGIAFNKDITENMKKYQIGEVVCPVFGGATANTEFEVLTGMSMYFFGYGVIPYNVYLRRDIPSIVSVLRDEGYSTTAIHPNTGAFYNRDTVYRHLGFENFIDIAGFDLKSDLKGPHVSDESLIKKIFGVLSEDQKPKFIFAISMQNHDPYYNNYPSLDVHAESSLLDEREINILSNFAQGIYDADKSFGMLINALSQESYPSLVYFFGDHLPRLGEKGIYDIYNKLDYFSGADNIQRDIRLYKTPLAVWSNYKKIEPLEGPISPAQIAYGILNDSNVIYPSYFNILKELRTHYPVLKKVLTADTAADNQVIKDYRMIQYDLLFGNQYSKETD